MSVMGVAQQYELEAIQNAGGGAMDTTPIVSSQHSELAANFLTLQSSHEASLQNQLLQESAVFLTEADHINGTNIVAPMHVSMPELASPIFMEAVESTPQVLAAPPPFIPDFPTHSDMFALVTPLEDTMNLEMSSSPPQTQIPSPSIHGTASSYSAGVTSSLESALDPAGVTTGRSRANTSVSPPIISGTFAPISPPSQQPIGIAFPAAEVVSPKQEEVNSQVLELMLKG